MYQPQTGCELPVFTLYFCEIKKVLAAICEMKEKLVQKNTIRLLLFMIINTIFKEQTLKRNAEF